MKFTKFFLIFLIINFGALALGTLLMNNGPQTDWYLQLNKAPWTPQGWVFGAAWSTIMLCFSFYMTYLYLALPNTKVKILFTIQFILNVSWNFIFFNIHFVFIALIVILALTVIVSVMFLAFKNHLKAKSILIIPYVIWLFIATSLNAFILLNN